MSDNLSEYVTTQEAAELLGVTQRRVRALIEAGRLPGTKLGNTRVLLIKRSDLALVADRKPERPWSKKVGQPKKK